MKNLARSIAIFLITTYIDAVYRYANSLSRNTVFPLNQIPLVGAGLLAKASCQSP